ncbi:MAG: peptidylprolyl isomerase, partial [Acidobacteriaceae bacterium]|nr:peptidylprolyl isomerase [Acidobacteriaceae bacterium]
MIRFLQTQGPIKKIILGGMLTVICVMMAITLIPGGFLGDAFGFGGAGQGVFAKVGGQEVTVQDVLVRSQRMARQQKLPPQFMTLVEQRVAEQLVLQKAMLAEASRLGIRVTDDEVAQELRSGGLGATLFPNGNFIGQAQYETLVSQNYQMSVGQFEQEVKDALILRKLVNLVQDGVTVSDADLQQEYQTQNVKVKFEYALLSLDSLKEQVHPTEAELKTYFDKNESRYANAIPEKRKIDYVVIDTNKVAETTSVTPDDLKRYYNQHRDEFRVADEVNVRHILIKTPPAGAVGKVDPQAEAAAKTKAEDVLKKVKAGGNFADLAKKYSEDEGSKGQGGSLGWIGKGRTVPEFEKAAFALDKGQTSDIVQSSFGFHIIHVDDKRTAHVQTLDEVKSQIEPLVKQEKTANAAESLANTVATQARTGGLEAAAAKNGLKVEHSPLVARTDTLPGIGAAPQFMDAAFGANAKNPPEVMNIPQGYAIYQVTEIKQPTKPTFEEVKAQVENDFRQERASALLRQKTNELADRARAEHDLKKAAKELGATVKTSELVTRQSQVPDLGAMSGQAAVAFTLKPGEISGPVDQGRNGFVLSVLERQEPSLADFQAAKERIREQLLQHKR